MKKEFGYYQFKWTAFFIAILIIGFTIAGYFHSDKDPTAENQPVPSPQFPQVNSDGFISNQSFAQLIEANLKELELLKNVSFTGGDDGTFSINAIVSNPSNLVSIADELKPYELFLATLKEKSISLNGHLSENAQGNGMLNIDSIIYSGQTIPAAAITPYIEKYTSLNDLVDVPYHEITIDPTGVTFSKEIPTFIQTVFDNPDSLQVLPRE